MAFLEDLFSYTTEKIPERRICSLSGIWFVKDIYFTFVNGNSWSDSPFQWYHVHHLSDYQGEVQILSFLYLRHML